MEKASSCELRVTSQERPQKSHGSRLVARGSWLVARGSHSEEVRSTPEPQFRVLSSSLGGGKQ